ncbi:hypothetical protein AB0N73_09585 [Microbacterium sp. NPDC089189]|uniref:hypothetical protein n=1 Tax=Microbacterium sp. NPDC089189 TaxID=3154972 RepID=UPI0034269E12
MTDHGDLGAHTGAGSRFTQHPAGSRETPVEAILDAAVVSWYPPYQAEVHAIREGLRADVKQEFAADTARLLAEDPSRRDLLAPAAWRDALRLLGFLAGATTIACILTALGFARRNEPIDASTVAVTVAVASTIALAALGASLLFPSRMGVPSRLASISLWLATVGSLGSAAALPSRPDTWDAATPALCVLTGVSGLALLVLAVRVSYARRPRAHGPAHITEEDVTALRLAVITAALDRSTAAVRSAWQRLDARTRRALERERDDAIDALEERDPSRIDAAWMRSVPPGAHGLPALADQIHELMHLGDAQAVSRAEPGRYGHFVKRSRRLSSQDG